MLSECPAATVTAPIEIVWDLLTSPAAYGPWLGVRVIRVVPAGAAHVGQEVVVGRGGVGGRRWTMRLTIERVDSATGIFAFRAELPLGIRLQERISCATVSGGTRVQFG